MSVPRCATESATVAKPQRYTISDRGIAVKYRLTLAFRTLRSQGYLAKQDIPWARWGFETRAPWKRLSRHLRHEASEVVRRKAIATGMIWYDADAAEQLNLLYPRVRVNGMRTTLDYGASFTGRPIYMIMDDIKAALQAHGLTVEVPGHPHRDENDDWVYASISDAVMEAAEAAYKFNGREGFETVLDPRRKTTDKES